MPDPLPESRTVSRTVFWIRRAIVGGVAVLVLIVGGYLGWSRLKSHGFRIELPSRLGANISQTADGFTYSQSQKGHTLFTIHASKVIEHKGEQAELHDVTITLYGPEGSGRKDTVHGAVFSYDRKRGIARADGAVSIDLTPPTGQDGRQAQSGAIHVTTSGLVFDQTTGEATTAQKVYFAFTQASGSALGADYNAKSGVLVLDKEVALEAKSPGGRQGEDAVIHAEHAQLLREAHQAYLIHPQSVYDGEHTSADQATLTFRADGSAEQLDARGRVVLTAKDGSVVHCGSAVVELDPGSRPTIAHLGGGITYNGDQDGQSMQGVANTGTLTFAAGGHGEGGRQQAELRHAQFVDAVSFVAQQRSFGGDPHGSSTREVRASKLNVDFAPGANGHAQAERAVAEGGAGITLHDIPAKAPARTTTVTGDQLTATLVDGHTLRAIDGRGNTKIVDSSNPGASSTSTGDTLHLTFAPSGVRSAKAEGAAELDSAIQTGHVSITQLAAPDPKTGAQPAPLTATAERAEYRAGDQQLHLTGNPRLHNDELAVSADRVDYRRENGDATALGNVKATYAQTGVQTGSAEKAPSLGGEGPVHIVADHAQLTRATGLSVFYGAPGAPARIWQGANAIDAPVIELAQAEQTLDAHGANGARSAAAAVRATLGSAVKAGAKAGPKAGPAPSGEIGPGGQNGQRGEDGQGAPVRITASTLHYSDKDRLADLHGPVAVAQPTGEVHSDQAQIYLTAAVPGKPSSVDRMVAGGHVTITQPGRRGTGEKLVYTAADGRYDLTGTPHEPPRVTDAEKGTTTGAALIFRGADQSVEVSSQGAHPARTVTDTRTSK